MKVIVEFLRSFRQHPKGFKFIFFGELAERASYYGMTALLANYLTDILAFTESQGIVVKHVFNASCYLLCLIGAYLADKHLGKFKTIIYFCIPYIFGHIVLGSFQTATMLFPALALLALGSGTIKPNISPLMGMMYDHEGKSKELRTQAFAWFYAAINIGAAGTMTILPLIRDYYGHQMVFNPNTFLVKWTITAYGYKVAFIAPTILMAVSFLLFALGKKYYPKEDVRKTLVIVNNKLEVRNFTWSIIYVFAFVSVFWFLFDQMGSSLVYFAKEYIDLHGMPSDWYQWINPILVIFFSPLFVLMWQGMTKKGFDFTHTKKMTVGFILAFLCTLILVVAGFSTDGNGAKISIIWLIIVYIFLTLAELCISVSGLELAYAKAPDAVKSRITGIWLVFVAVGNIMGALVGSLYNKLTPSGYFSIFAVVILAACLGFHFTSRRFEQKFGS